MSGLFGAQFLEDARIEVRALFTSTPIRPHFSIADVAAATAPWSTYRSEVR
jgi:hypothetical protein